MISIASARGVGERRLKWKATLATRRPRARNVAEQRTSVENIRSADRSSLAADVRITIALDNGDTYTTYRRLLREKRRL